MRKCNYTVRECLLLPRDAAMLARSWDLTSVYVAPKLTSVRLSVRLSHACFTAFWLIQRTYR